MFICRKVKDKAKFRNTNNTYSYLILPLLGNNLFPQKVVHFYVVLLLLHVARLDPPVCKYCWML